MVAAWYRRRRADALSNTSSSDDEDSWTGSWIDSPDGLLNGLVINLTYTLGFSPPSMAYLRGFGFSGFQREIPEPMSRCPEILVDSGDAISDRIPNRVKGQDQLSEACQVSGQFMK